MVAQPLTAAGERSRFLSAVEPGPARVGTEACAMAHCQLLEPRHHVGSPPRAGVGERAAAEGGEARPEHDRRIDQVCILDHALTQAGYALVDQHEDHAVAEISRGRAARGAVVFSTHHPAMDWQLYSPEDYFAVKQVTEAWTRDGESFDVTVWRRPLTAMTEAISGAGFVIDQLVEPAPAAELRQRDPKNHDKIRMSPRFLFFRLVKRSFTPNV